MIAAVSQSTFLIIQIAILVVAVLTLLIVVGLRRKGSASVEDAGATPAPAQQAEPVAVRSAPAAEDGATVAAIVAAVTLMLEQEAVASGRPRPSFKVKSIKKI